MDDEISSQLEDIVLGVTHLTTTTTAGTWLLRCHSVSLSRSLEPGCNLRTRNLRGVGRFNLGTSKGYSRFKTGFRPQFLVRVLIAPSVESH